MNYKNERSVSEMNDILRCEAYLIGDTCGDALHDLENTYVKPPQKFEKEKPSFLEWMKAKKEELQHEHPTLTKKEIHLMAIALYKEQNMTISTKKQVASKTIASSRHRTHTHVPR